MAIDPSLQNTVQAAFDVQDYVHARALIEHALTADKGDKQLFACLATANAHGSRFTTARGQIAQLLAELTPASRLHWSGVFGFVWSELGRYDLTEPLLREALRQPEAVALVHEKLADALEHLRRLPEALETTRAGLARFPMHPGIMVVRARILRRMDDLDQAQAALRKVIHSPITSAAAKTAAFYEMGHLREAQGRYAEAFAAFTQAKTLQKKAEARFVNLWHQRQATAANADLLPTQEDFARFAEAAQPLHNPSRRIAFLVGCPRSGTTLLERVLETHPGLVGASETATFGHEVWGPLVASLHAERKVEGMADALRRVTSALLEKARDTHWALLPDALEQAVDGRLVLDKNPSSLAIVSAIKCLHPEAPLLVARRDPRALLWSCYTQHFTVNAESAAFLDLNTTSAHISTLLQNWVTLRQRIAQPWHEVWYEKTVKDLPGQAHEILNFLGLPWREEVLAYHARNDLVRSPSYSQASQPIYDTSLAMWQNYAEFLTPHLHPLLPYLDE